MVTAKQQTRSQLWLLHWIMALLFVVIFGLGLYMTNLPPRDPSAGALYNFHKSLGVVVMGLLTVRIFLVLRTLGPKRPKNWLPTAALHTALYTLMVIVPLSGYFLSNTAGRAVNLFGLPLPTLFGENKPFADTAGMMHSWIAYTFAAFVGVHLISQRKVIAANTKRLMQRTRSSAS